MHELSNFYCIHTRSDLFCQLVILEILFMFWIILSQV